LFDSVLIANEIVEEIKKKKKSGVVVKIDYEKAYDFVNWNFFYYTMDRLGFSS